MREVQYMTKNKQYILVTVFAVIITVLVGTCTFKTGKAPECVTMPNYRDGTVEDVYPDGRREVIGWIEVLNERGDCIYHFFDEETSNGEMDVQ